MPPNKVVKRRMTKRRLVNDLLSIQTHKMSFAQLKASIESLTAMVQGEKYELPTMAISSLNIGDVQSMLNLSFSPNDTELHNQPVIEPFAICGTYTQMSIDGHITDLNKLNRWDLPEMHLETVKEMKH